MKISKHTSYSIQVGNANATLRFEPLDNTVLIERTNDKLVVGYLVQDSDPLNPMEKDSQGNIYTMPSRGWGGRSITDNASEIYSALGVDGYGGVDVDNTFACEPYTDWKGIQQKSHSLRDFAALQFLDDMSQDVDLTEKWFTEKDIAVAGTFLQALAERREEIWQDLEDCDGVFSEEVETLAISLYPKYWQQIAGPYVVVLDYSEGQEVSISPTTWDGDPDDLPNAIWVADKGAIENLQGSENLRSAIEEYAAGVCKEYESWCNGDVYGCVVQTFELKDGEWEELNEDICWGFVGMEHALESLKAEFFESAVEEIKK